MLAFAIIMHSVLFATSLILLLLLPLSIQQDPTAIPWTEYNQTENKCRVVATLEHTGNKSIVLTEDKQNLTIVYHDGFVAVTDRVNLTAAYFFDSGLSKQQGTDHYYYGQASILNLNHNPILPVNQTLKLDENGYDFKNINVTQVQAAAFVEHSQRSYLIVLEQGISITRYHQFIFHDIKPNNVYLQSQSFQIGEMLVPTALTFLRYDGQQNTFIVFYNRFWTEVSLAHGSADLIMPSNPNDLQLSEFKLADEWAGCAATLCFDGQLDAISTNVDNTITIIRGSYYWIANELTDSKTELPRAFLLDSNLRMDLARPVDAISTINDTTYYFEGDEVRASPNVTTIPFSIFFGGIPKITGPVDAATYYNNVLFVLKGDSYWMYAMRANHRTNLVKTEYESFIIEQQADALLTHKQKMYWFKGNFFYQVDVDSRTTLKPMLIQGNLFNCLDEYYVNIGADMLFNVKTFDEFRVKMFKEIGVTVVTRKPLTTSKGPVQPSKATKSNKLGWMVISAIVLGALVVVFLIVFMVVRHRHKIDHPYLLEEKSINSTTHSMNSNSTEMITKGFIPTHVKDANSHQSTSVSVSEFE